MNPGAGSGPRQKPTRNDDILEAEYRVIKD